MYVAFALLADAANVSRDGKLNVLGVFDTVHAATLPTVHPRAMLVVRLKTLPEDAGTHRVGIAFSAPGGATIWSTEAELTVGALPPGFGEGEVPFVVQIDLPLAQTGRHAIALTLDGQVVVQLPLGVVGVAAPPPAFAPAPGAPLMS